MPVQIEASPKIRDARPREAKARQTQARFVVRDRAQTQEPRSGGATRILKVAFVLFLLAMGVHALWSRIQGPDPHFLTARKLVHDYEYGKPKKIRNYENVAYQQALAELALVNPNSRSAKPARALRIELEREIAAFREQQRRINQQLNSARVKIRKKKEFEAQARLQSLMAPQTEFPECEFEEHGDSGKQHEH